ncbi:hypothetical protein DHEL01_v210396 [Diaporthe helianthi]|uniref:Peptidase S8/S53 domain-containing protein n=1 Tax=Diaporthe helianthi TaxID=158607 RepID=A0A2P5HLQ6_DIAHE|nr:hypothetical protein DHEL01_v210396 [Diaporthe helianthi]
MRLVASLCILAGAIVDSIPTQSAQQSLAIDTATPATSLGALGEQTTESHVIAHTIIVTAESTTTILDGARVPSNSPPTGWDTTLSSMPVSSWAQIPRPTTFVDTIWLSFSHTDFCVESAVSFKLNFFRPESQPLNLGYRHHHKLVINHGDIIRPASINTLAFDAAVLCYNTKQLAFADYYPPIPGQDPLVIILSDSTTATITSSAIIRDGASLAIPSYQELSQNGGLSSQQLSSWSVQFGTRRFQPPACVLSTFSCFLQAQAHFMGMASSIRDSFVSLAATMMQAGIVDAATAAGYASEASSHSVTAGSLLDGLSNTLSSLEGAAEALDGAMQAVNENLASFTSIELEELTEAGRIFASYPEVSLAKGMFSNLEKIMRLAWANSPDVIQSLWGLCQAQWLPITAGGAVITSVWVLNEIGNGEETVQQPDEERVHFILLEQGFSIPVFHLWTFTLDEDKGTKTAIDTSVNDDLTQRGLEPAYGPGYTTKITIPQATIVRALPFVRIVYMYPTFDQKRRWDTMIYYGPDGSEGSEGSEGSWRSGDSKASQNRSSENGVAATRKRGLEQNQAQRNLAAFSHHKGVAEEFTYTRDSSGGEGVAIFITDSGGSIDGPFWRLPDMGTPDALHDGYFHIVQTVKDRGLHGRSVISNSNEYEVEEMMKDLSDFLEAVTAVHDDIQKAAKSNGIIWVQSVGNQGAYPPGSVDPRTVPDVIAGIGDMVPMFGTTSDSEMITVSGALEDGTLWPGASPRGVHVGDVFIQDDNDPRLPEGTSLGWIDVYAPAYEMPSCSLQDGIMTMAEQQTSGATAQVPGYQLGLNLDSELDTVDRSFLVNMDHDDNTLAYQLRHRNIQF